MKKPIFLVEDDPTIDAAFTRLNEVRKRHLAEIKKLEQEHDVEHKLCWEAVENKLIELGKIPDHEQRLAFEDGVIFLKDKEEKKEELKSNIREALKGVFYSLAD